MLKITKIAYSKNLTKSKCQKLAEIALRLGNLRTEVWAKFGSINGTKIKHREIRDKWLEEKRKFDIPARLWKSTLDNVMSDITMCREAAKVKVRKDIFKRTKDKVELKRMYGLLKSNNWTEDYYLCRLMRKYYKHGKTNVKNQIILDTNSYSTFKKNGKCWLSVQSLEKGKRICVPLSTNVTPKNTLRIIIAEGNIEVHYSIEEVTHKKPCGTSTVGVDKGYTEAFTDSDGVKHGQGLGTILSSESDFRKEKYKNRNKIKSVVDKAKKSGNIEKVKRIIDNNLGRKKLETRKDKHEKNVRTMIFNATHKVVDKASVVVAEDLTSVMRNKKKISRNQKRRLSGWAKGLLAEALASVTRRRSASFVLVNAAYTSQMDSITGLLEGKRVGDKFYHENGEVSDADWNAARNILRRLADFEIKLFTKFTTVKSILLKRTKRVRLGLLNQDTRLSNVPSQ